MQFAYQVESSKELQMKGDVQDKHTIFTPAQVILVNLDFELTSYPISVASMLMDLNLGIATQRIKTYLPITITHFCEFVKIGAD
jgi:hypothetical protein